MFGHLTDQTYQKLGNYNKCGTYKEIEESVTDISMSVRLSSVADLAHDFSRLVAMIKPKVGVKLLSIISCQNL